MNNIVGILDMDGFRVNKTFYCRELGVINVNEDIGTSYHFDTGLDWSNLTVKEQKCCAYVCRHIIKLPFKAHRGSLPLSNLHGIVNDFYANIKKSEKSVLAYKGGHLEESMLKELNIPAINLESFACPKAVCLFGKLPWIETCEQHFGTEQHEHCPKVEVEAYAMWFRENKEKWTEIEQHKI